MVHGWGFTELARQGKPGETNKAFTAAGGVYELRESFSGRANDCRITALLSRLVSDTYTLGQLVFFPV